MRQLQDALAKEDTGVLIHCSAGLHRTGMVANALLRFIGHDEAGALEVNNMDVFGRTLAVVANGIHIRCYARAERKRQVGWGSIALRGLTRSWHGPKSSSERDAGLGKHR
jgi:hypothetical protein